MECQICFDQWDSNSCVPLMLNCGHSFCEDCLVLMMPKNMDQPYPATMTVDCPNNCGKPTTLTKKESQQQKVQLWYT